MKRQIFALCACALLLLSAAAAPRVCAQQNTTEGSDRDRAFQLTRAGRYTEALPLLEKLAAANPKDTVVFEMYGVAILSKAESIPDEEARRLERKRGREMLVRARELGGNSPELLTLLEGIPPDGGTLALSSNKEADAALRQGEEAFNKGEYDKALAAYERAFKLDPKLYEAALFAGDAYYRTKRYEKAVEWFARAAAINPDREQAHRFWGDALLEAGKMDAARDRFIDAIIAEPTNRLTWSGLLHWAQKNHLELAHPVVDIKASLSFSGEKNLDVYIDPALRESTDGSRAWEFYATERVEWITQRFAKEFPNEESYRHTLREETAGLRKAIEIANGDLKAGRIKTLSPSLSNLVKLDQAGLLEPYVFFALPDEELMQDYEAYRQSNRDKLRRYLLEFVIPKK